MSADVMFGSSYSPKKSLTGLVLAGNIGSNPSASSSARARSCASLTTSLHIRPRCSRDRPTSPEPGGPAFLRFSRRASAQDRKRATSSRTSSSLPAGSGSPPLLYSSPAPKSTPIMLRNALYVLYSAPSSTGRLTISATSAKMPARDAAILSPAP